MARRTDTELKLDDKGRMVYRFDKTKDGSVSSFLRVRPDTARHKLMLDSYVGAGWYQVDADEADAYDAERAEEARAARDEADRALHAQLNMRYGTFTSLEGPTGTETASRGRGRPSNAEKAAKAEADEAKRLLAEAQERIAELEQAQADAGAGS